MKVRDFIILFIVWILISVLAPQEEVSWPLYTTVLVAVLFLYGATDQWWQALRFEGDHCIADLKRDKGHTTFHPEDLREPISSGGESFQTLATGGFSAAEFGWNGSENFLVFPPDHLEKFPDGIAIHTNFHRVSFHSLPDYIQQDLMKLYYFSPSYAEKKNNLWFGMTSKKLGTSNEENQRHETAWLEENSAINSVLDKLREKAKNEEPKSAIWEDNL